MIGRQAKNEGCDDAQVARTLLTELATAINEHGHLPALLADGSDACAMAVAALGESVDPALVTLTYGLPRPGSTRFAIAIDSMQSDGLFLLCMYGVPEASQSLGVTLTTDGEMVDWAGGAGISLSASATAADQLVRFASESSSRRGIAHSGTSSRALTSGASLKTLIPESTLEGEVQISAIDLYPAAVLVHYLIDPSSASESARSPAHSAPVPRLKSDEGAELECIRDVRRGVDPIVGSATFVPLIRIDEAVLIRSVGEAWIRVPVKQAETQ